MLLDPLFASGSERAEQENCALIANQYVRSIRDNLRRTAHGCVLLSSNTHQVTKIEKAPSLSGAVVETVCTLCHIRLSAYHRASPNVGWSRFRAVLMLDWILPASALRWNSTKVWKRNPSRCVNKISRPKRPLGYRRGGGPGQQPRRTAMQFFPHTRGPFQPSTCTRTSWQCASPDISTYSMLI